MDEGRYIYLLLSNLKIASYKKCKLEKNSM